MITKPPDAQVEWMREAGCIYQDCDPNSGESYYLAPGNEHLTVPIKATNPAELMRHCLTSTRLNTEKGIRTKAQALCRALGISTVP